MNQFKIPTMLFNYLTQNSSHTEMNQLHMSYVSVLIITNFTAMGSARRWPSMA